MRKNSFFNYESPALTAELQAHIHKHPTSNVQRSIKIVRLSVMGFRFGGLWYAGPEAISNAIGYAKFYSCSHAAVIRVFDKAGNLIETHEQTGDLKEW